MGRGLQSKIQRTRAKNNEAHGFLGMAYKAAPAAKVNPGRASMAAGMRVPFTDPIDGMVRAKPFA